MAKMTHQVYVDVVPRVMPAAIAELREAAASMHRRADSIDQTADSLSQYLAPAPVQHEHTSAIRRWIAGETIEGHELFADLNHWWNYLGGEVPNPAPHPVELVRRLRDALAHYAIRSTYPEDAIADVAAANAWLAEHDEGTIT